nr:hypothetical protein TetV2_00170 [Oceanusvirus sp.]
MGDSEEESCVVCLDSLPEANSKTVCISSCRSGCRGTDAVCAECYRGLSKCVYCRRKIDIVECACDTIEAGEATKIVGALTFSLFLFFFFVVSLAGGSGEDAPREPLEISSAFGAPIILSE